MSTIRSLFNFEEFSNEELKILHESVKLVEKNFKNQNLEQVTLYVDHLLKEVQENQSKLHDDPKFNVTDYKLLEKLGNRLQKIQKVIDDIQHPEKG